VCPFCEVTVGMGLPATYLQAVCVSLLSQPLSCPKAGGLGSKTQAVPCTHTGSPRAPSFPVIREGMAVGAKVGFTGDSAMTHPDFRWSFVSSCSHHHAL
jgi:hypothetical protein